MRGIFNNEYFGRNSMTYRIGIDLGGTKIIGAIFDEKHKKLASIKKNTKGFQGPEVTIKRIVDLIYSLLKTSHLSVQAISSIGFGVPSSVDHLSGKMLTAPNLGWKDVNLKVAIEKEFGIFTYVENDVNAGTYGEYVMTLKKKYEHVVGIFLAQVLAEDSLLMGSFFMAHVGWRVKSAIWCLNRTVFYADVEIKDALRRSHRNPVCCIK